MLLLLACTGAPKPDDTGTPLDDTGPSPSRSLGESDAIIYGNESDAAGTSVTFGGDDDGDGRDTVIVAASFLGQVCAFRAPSGEMPVLSGDACWTPETTRDYAGTAIEGGRDLTGDGLGDLLVGAIANDETGAEAGKVYLLPAPYTSGAMGDAPAQLTGEAERDYFGTSMAMVGDVDGDGAEDLLVGAPANITGGAGGGRAYLYRGPLAEGTLASTAAFATVTGEGTTTKVFHGAPAAGDGVGSVAAGVGDVDGDGLADLWLGANGNEVGGNDAGLAALFLGPVGEGDHALADADQRWIGESVGQYVGDSVAGPGDLDGDGLADLVTTSDTSLTGTTWVIFGPGTPGDSSISAADVRIDGAADGDLAGAAVRGAGDTDGDGSPDLVIGAYGRDGAEADVGAAYVVTGPFTAGSIALGSQIPWLGRSGADAAGRAVAGGGDVDGDGRADVLVGAPYADSYAIYGGEAYVLLSR